MPVLDLDFLARPTPELWDKLRSLQEAARNCRQSRASMAGRRDKFSRRCMVTASVALKENEDKINQLRSVLKARGEDIR